MRQLAVGRGLTRLDGDELCDELALQAWNAAASSAGVAPRPDLARAGMIHDASLPRRLDPIAHRRRRTSRFAGDDDSRDAGVRKIEPALRRRLDEMEGVGRRAEQDR